MKGFKAFSHGMVCRGKQYAENTTFEEDAAVMCEKGLHFCANPLDCLMHYDLVDEDGNIVEIAEVECADEDVIADELKTKFVSKKLKVNKKLSFEEWVKASCAKGNRSHLTASGDESQLSASKFYSCLASSGDGNLLAASEGSSHLASSGYHNQLAASEYNSRLASSGDRSQLAASGYNSHLAASGDYSRLTASWDGSCLASSGDANRIAARENSIAAAVGVNSRVKAGIGSWIVLAEWEGIKPKCVKAAMIDGKILKPDVWYELKNGEIVPVEHN